MQALALMAMLLVLAGGCSARQVTLTDRSGIEQELLVRSLERAVAGLDVSRLTGRRVRRWSCTRSPRIRRSRASSWRPAWSAAAST